MCYNSLDNWPIVNTDGDQRDEIVKDVGKKNEGSLTEVLEYQSMNHL